ncbi:CaiB/BaiF CoA-transferase family protein [Vineibacter terrae]|uniref:CaiB/BaiF CoA transferase family protein n=1 Tax=Vineibacter terrae TaxID=2586908 RepID=UPI002E31F30D|nr:CaiB/BaiF CoA-transferase family protein [Vineibacter terrae]HEX2886399.1 CaiB/BaiF CoA-transferase family protein [Vineibacter terrae]
MTFEEQRMAQRPLHGVVVLDLSARLPGPLATLMLAQAGARVIKVERPPEGDEVRAFAPQVDGMSAHFVWLNRGKQSVTLDLKRRGDLAAFEDLVAQADVLVEQFRPGVMDRLGLGPDALCRRHARLIYCSITGYGRDDPRSLDAAHDLNYQADAGLVGTAPLLASGTPALPPVLLGDIAGGSYPAFMSILLALMQRQQTDKGQFLDIAMSRNIEVFTFWNVIQGTLTGTWPEPGTGRHTGGSPRYQVYRTADDRFLAVAALEDRFWHNFQQAIGLTVRPDWERHAPREVIAAVAARIARHDASHWLAVMAGKDVCCNLAPDLEQAVAANAARRAEAGRGSMPLIPLPLAPQFTSGPANLPAPPLGASNETLARAQTPRDRPARMV